MSAKANIGAELFPHSLFFFFFPKSLGIFSDFTFYPGVYIVPLSLLLVTLQHQRCFTILDQPSKLKPSLSLFCFYKYNAISMIIINLSLQFSFYFFWSD